MTAFTIQFEPPDKILLVTSWTKIFDVKNFISKDLFVRRPGVAIFADIINFLIMFIKTIFKDSRIKVKRIINYVSKLNLYLYFLI